jgi:hypothetical protein
MADSGAVAYRASRRYRWNVAVSSALSPGIAAVQAFRRDPWTTIRTAWCCASATYADPIPCRGCGSPARALEYLGPARRRRGRVRAVVQIVSEPSLPYEEDHRRNFIGREMTRTEWYRIDDTSVQTRLIQCKPLTRAPLLGSGLNLPGSPSPHCGLARSNARIAKKKTEPACGGD